MVALWGAGAAVAVADVLLDEEDEDDEEDEEDKEDEEEGEKDKGWFPSWKRVQRWPVQMCCLMKKMKRMKVKKKMIKKTKKKMKKMKVSRPLRSRCGAGRCRCVAWLRELPLGESTPVVPILMQ